MVSYLDRLLEHSKEFDGLITVAVARELGIPIVELRKLAQRGKLTRIGRGVYRTQFGRFEHSSGYREALALVGPESFLYGDSALSFLKVGVFSSRKYLVATSRRVRKKLPIEISLKKVRDISVYDVVELDYVRTQSAYSALTEKILTTEPERILDALRDAVDQGHVSSEQAIALRESIQSQKFNDLSLLAHLD
jgi:hypothetical protein